MVDSNGVERCEFMHAHEDIIDKVNQEMPEEEILYDLAELFDIAQLLNMNQSAISHQLRVLKQSQLVKFRREGKTVFYSLADGHVRTILSQGMEHLAE